MQILDICAETHRGFFLTSVTDERPTPLVSGRYTWKLETERDPSFRLEDVRFSLPVQLQEFRRIPKLLTASSSFVSSASNLAWHQFTQRWSDCTDCLEWGISKDQDMGGILNQSVWGPLEFGLAVISLYCAKVLGLRVGPWRSKDCEAFKNILSPGMLGPQLMSHALNIEQYRWISMVLGWMSSGKFLRTCSSSFMLQTPGANPTCSINSKRAAQGVHRNYKHRTLSSCIHNYSIQLSIYISYNLLILFSVGVSIMFKSCLPGCSWYSCLKALRTRSWTRWRCIDTSAWC